MVNTKEIADALNEIVAGVPGDNILEAFKESLLTENLFKKLFGQTGERIVCNTQISHNLKTVPALEMRFKTDTAQSHDAYIDGRIEGRMLFPTSFKDEDLTVRRKMAFALLRFLQSPRFDIFERVPGLIEFGTNITFNYAVAFTIGAHSFPGILIEIPTRVDQHLWQKAHPEIDPLEQLDGEEFEIQTYEIAYQVEKDGEYETVFTDSIPNEDE